MKFLGQQFFHLLKVIALCTLATTVFSQELKTADPVFVRTITSPYEQYNDIHPTWSPKGDIISFERYDANKHEIILSDIDSNKLQTVSISNESQFNLDDILGNSSKNISYNSGISWAPNNKKFVFTSNGKFNNFDLYIGKVGEVNSKRLTFHHQKDSHADWSSDGRYISFISSRNGYAQLYRFNTTSGEMINLVNNQKNTFYPVWSPDSKKIVFMMEVDNVFQIYVINDTNRPLESLQAITQLSNTNTRPSWSQDGKNIAFFHQSETLKENADEDSQWDIVIVDAAIARPLSDEELSMYRISENVIMNSETGPTWIPGTNYIAYVKNENEKYNPIHLVNIINKETFLLNTNTMLNKDLSCSDQGLLAFQTQDRQWSRIFIAKLPELKG